MSKTKGAIVSAAFRKARISGITTQPTGDELSGAVETLEDMMRELESKNACPSYAFEDAPDLATDSKLEPRWYHAVQSRLALLLCSDFGIDPGATLRMQAKQAWSSMIGKLTMPEQIGQPNRMPRGSGNMFRTPLWTRYYHSTDKAPIDCDTIKIKDGEIYPLTVMFEGYLNTGEFIESYTVKDVGNGLTVMQDMMTEDTRGVEMVVKATKCGSYSLVVEIQTTIGRQYPEKVWFKVESV